MNILYYLDWFPKLSQSFILNEIHYLTQNGHNVAVFSLNRPSERHQHEEVTDLDIEIAYADLPSGITIPRHLLSQKVSKRWLSEAIKLPKVRQIVGTPYLAKQCLDFIKSLPYSLDAIHSHFLTWNKLPAALVADDLGIQSSLTTHAYDLFGSPNERILNRVSEHFDRHLTISEYNKSFLETEIEAVEQAEISRMGIRPEKFKPTEQTTSNRVLTVARLIEKKGLSYGLSAIADVVAKIPSLSYHIVGEGSRRDQLESQARRLAIEDNVQFLGSVDD